MHLPWGQISVNYSMWFMLMEIIHASATKFQYTKISAASEKIRKAATPTNEKISRHSIAVERLTWQYQEHKQLQFEDQAFLSF